MQACLTGPASALTRAPADNVPDSAVVDVEYIDVVLDADNAALTQGLSRAFDCGSATQRLAAGASSAVNVGE